MASRKATPGNEKLDAEPSTPADGEPTFDTIQRRWPELLGTASQYHPHIAQLLRQVEQMDLSDGTLRLFTKPLFLEKWGDEEKKAALERGVRELFGEQLVVEFADSTNAVERAKVNGGEVNPLEDLIPIARELGAEVMEKESE